MAADRRGWLVMSARFLTRSLRLRATTLLFALTAVTVGAGVAATMLNLEADLSAKMSRELRRYGPNLLLVPKADRVPPTLDEDVVEAAIGARGSGTAGAALLVAAGEVFGRDRSNPAAAAVVGARFASLRTVNPSWRIEGAWPASDDGACLLGADLAAREGLAAGDAAHVALEAAHGGGSLTLRVAGVVSTGEAEDGQIFVPLGALQEATGLRGRVSLAALSVDGGEAAVDRAAGRLQTMVAGSSARPLRPIAAAQGAVLEKLDRMMLLLTAVVLVLSGLCLATTLMAMVVEREAEIGLMRSMGAGDGDVARIFLGEVSLLGLAGGALGLLLGFGGARLIGRHLFGTAIDARLQVVPTVILIALAVCWTSVLVPLRRALRIQPAAALRGE